MMTVTFKTKEVFYNMSGLNDILIEGYNPDKVAELERERQYDVWNDIAKAQQTERIVGEKLVGFEMHRINEQKTLCGVVRIGKVKGLIPIDESGIDPNDPYALNKFRALANMQIQFIILRYSMEADMFVASRKKARDLTAQITLSKIKEGFNIYCVVREVEKGHLIGDIGGIDVHVPAFELSYGWVDDLRAMYKTGDHIRVQVTEMKDDKIKVSRKPLMENPFPECLSRYVPNGEYVGTVSGVQAYGIFVALEEGVDCLAQHLKFQNVEKGSKVLVRIVRVESKGSNKIHAKIVRVMS